MHIKKSLYSILQYLSTINDTFLYNANHVLVTNEKVGSGFVEVDVPDFFDETVVIKSLSKFLRLFSFGKPTKGSSTEPESLQDWTLETGLDGLTGAAIPEMYLRMPNRVVKIRQGSPFFIEKNKDQLRKRFDRLVLEDAIKFQIDNATYKQIISDCSLLDLDVVNIVSDSENKIKIYLTKRDKGFSDDFSSYTIECPHQHIPYTISFGINDFSLIDATDHQFEYGKFKLVSGDYAYVLKIKSFYNSEFTVKKVIVGNKGDK